MKDTPVFPSQPMERVHEGMTVVDATGRRLGTVGLLKMGDPGAATVAGNDPASTAVAGSGVNLGSALGVADPEPRVPDPLRRDLLRVGFIKLDGAEVPEDARYVLADRVDHVSGDTVHLGPDLATATTATTAASSVPSRPPQPRVAEPVTGVAATSTAAPYWEAETPPNRSRVMAAGVGVAGGSLLGIFGGGLAWLFAQWQRSRNEPPTRVRRQLQRLGRSTPRVRRSEQRPWLVPALGVGGSLLAGGGYLFWRLRHEDDADVTTGAWGSSGSTDTLGRVAQEGGRLQLVEEELQAQKRDVGGEVRLSKEVVTEERSVDVPLTREEIVVQRRAVDRQPTSEPVGTDEEIEVRATAEKVVGVEKDTIVTEEVRVGKRVEQESQHVSDTVRREVLRVEREGDGRVREESDVQRERPADRP